MEEKTITEEQALQYADLMLRYGDLLNSICIAKSETLEEAQEFQAAAEDAVWNGMRTFRADYSESQQKRWFRTVVHSAVVDCFRHRHHKLPLTGNLHNRISIDPDDSDNEILDELVSYLPESDKQFVARLREGYFLPEIAKEMHITPSGARKRLHRIIEKLKIIKDKIYG